MLGKVLKEANKNEKRKGTEGQEVQNFNLLKISTEDFQEKNKLIQLTFFPKITDRYKKEIIYVEDQLTEKKTVTVSNENEE